MEGVVAGESSVATDENVDFGKVSAVAFVVDLASFARDMVDGSSVLGMRMHLLMLE